MKNYFLIIIVPVSLFFICCLQGNYNETEKLKKTKEISVLDTLLGYNFSCVNPSKENNYTFPKLPKFSLTRTNELLEIYLQNKELTEKVILNLLLKLHYCNLKCCNTQFVLTQNDTIIDSLRSPIVYIFLKSSDQLQAEKIFIGIGTKNVLDFAKESKWSKDSLIKTRITEIEYLTKIK